uniref:Uncharacterized protein n=1 Tax=Cucumis melo TaxID=3656 RepID=A0A9I9EI14_CUCME
MHLALSTMHLTLLSTSIMALSDAISVISFSPMLATILGSNPAKASLLPTKDNLLVIVHWDAPTLVVKRYIGFIYKPQSHYTKKYGSDSNCCPKKHFNCKHNLTTGMSDPVAPPQFSITKFLTLLLNTFRQWDFSSFRRRWIEESVREESFEFWDKDNDREDKDSEEVVRCNPIG